MEKFLDLIPLRNVNKLKEMNSKYSIFKKFFITDSERSYGDPLWYIASINMSNNPVGSINSSLVNSSAGSSIDKIEAVTKCIGEAIERYSSINYFSKDSLISMNIDHSKGFVRCAEKEKAPIAFKNINTIIHTEHTEVIKLCDNTKDYLPFEAVHFSFNTPIYCASLSTGCAFYDDEPTAILRGICETIERDALMRWWYTYFRNTKKINIEDINSYDLKERVRRIEEKNLSVFLYEISVFEGFPVVFCLIKGNSFPYACFGGSCNTNIKKAIIKSIDEAMSIRNMANFNGIKAIDTKDFYHINTLDKHMELYANWKESPIIEQLVSTSFEEATITSYKEIEDIKSIKDLERIAIDFKNKGFDIYYKNLTLPEVSDFGTVIKVIIPQMIPLSQSYSTRWLEPILKEIEAHEMNNFPQPFS